ncbi:hypothetical protein GWK47_038061 [Chionoecetes opilio]|uniref:Uncharacterized protein n=1 Tax=Chionoecetes opilio TaxID=41210 RepID=A0A8J4YED5_CHIOP|nr:hypothetical protein GWK47_038061 [Chionoecetes opilio]
MSQVSEKIQLNEDQERAPFRDAVLVASRHFTEMLNRGKLTKPSDFCLNVVKEICSMWRALMCTSRDKAPGAAGHQLL